MARRKKKYSKLSLYTFSKSITPTQNMTGVFASSRPFSTLDRGLAKMLGNKKKLRGVKDWDGDGVPNKKDCQPWNTMRQDKIYSVRPFREKFAKAVIPTDLDRDYWGDPNKKTWSEMKQSQYKHMVGRGTGWFGSGIYGFAHKGQAANLIKRSNPGSPFYGYIREFEIKKPLHLQTKEDSRLFHDTSKDWYHGELDNWTVALRFGRTGLDVTEQDLVKAMKYRRGQQPINRLMEMKGYDGVIPSKEFQNTGYGSVKYYTHPKTIPLDNKPFTDKQLERHRLNQQYKHKEAIRQKQIKEEQVEKSVREIQEAKGDWRKHLIESARTFEPQAVVETEGFAKFVERQEGASEEKQQEWVNKTPTQRGVERNVKSDIDNDLTPDEYDCKPHDPKEQGGEKFYQYLAQRGIYTQEMSKKEEKKLRQLFEKNPELIKQARGVIFTTKGLKGQQEGFYSPIRKEDLKLVEREAEERKLIKPTSIIGIRSRVLISEKGYREKIPDLPGKTPVSSLLRHELEHKRQYQEDPTEKYQRERQEAKALEEKYKQLVKQKFKEAGFTKKEQAGEFYEKEKTWIDKLQKEHKKETEQIPHEILARKAEQQQSVREQAIQEAKKTDWIGRAALADKDKDGFIAAADNDDNNPNNPRGGY